MSYRLISESEGAFDSPDHLHPRGSLNERGGPRYNWGKGYNPFLDEVRKYFGHIERPRLLDIGCGSGALVKDALKRGFDAAGIEGSDVPLKRGNRRWERYNGKRLFVTDASEEFQIVSGRKRIDGRPMKFHVITLWEVLEHFNPDKLHIVADNIHRHLEERGIVCVSISPWYEPAEGNPDVNLHLAHELKKRSQWEDIFKKFQFVGPVKGACECNYHYMFRFRYRGKCRCGKNKRTFWSTLVKK